ncbi:MAG: hypothetical protein J6R77_07625 [Clostridia bacterium]|nr:hypothetical protein [Clostridia bacterium]
MKRNGIWVTAGLCLLMVAVALSSLLFSRHPGKGVVVATVNGEPIYQSQIDFLRNSRQLSLANGLASIPQSGASEKQKAQMLEELKASAEKTDEELLLPLILQKIKEQEALRQGITVTYEEAYAQGATMFRQIKEAASHEDAPENAKKAWQLLCDLMAVNDMTEAEYLEQLVESSRRSIAIQRLEERLLAENTGNITDFYLYVDDLLQAAEIVYH